MKLSVVCPVKDEGPYLLEWIAWHKMIGFTDILVLSNDCSDGSEVLLDRLAERGLIRHIQHHPDEGQAPLASAYSIAFEDSGLRAADWVMALDADEFLQISAGQGRVRDLVETAGLNGIGIAIFWKTFGNGGQQNWEDGFVHEQFTQAAISDDFPNNHYKSLFKNMDRFRRMASHSPSGFKDTWGGENVWVDCTGAPLNNVSLTDPANRQRAVARRRLRHDFAQINHYAVKSDESFDLKRTKKSGASLIYRHDELFHDTYNKNDVEDHTALTRHTEFLEVYEALINDPATLAAHHATCAHYVTALCHASGQDHLRDPRYIQHRDLANTPIEKTPAD